MKAPSGGPATMPSAVAMLPRPNMRPPCRGKASTRIGAEFAVVIAAPPPCIALAATSHHREGAIEHRIDPTTNTAIPALYTRPRPSTSPARPNGRSVDVERSRNAVIVHWTSWIVPPRCC
jgi:hypothetical protein